MKFNSLSHLKNDKDSIMTMIVGCFSILVGFISFIFTGKFAGLVLMSTQGFVTILANHGLSQESKNVLSDTKQYKKIFGFELDRLGKFFIIFLISSMLFTSSFFTIIIPFYNDQYKNEIKELSCDELNALLADYESQYQSHATGEIYLQITKNQMIAIRCDI